jgi:hypothetical protein
MPFVFDPNLEDKDQDTAQGAGGQAAAPAMTGGGETFSGSGADGPAQPQSAMPQSQKGTSKAGSGFVNLDSYLKANQGNQFGQQFVGKVKGDVTQAQQGLGDVKNTFNTAVTQAGKPALELTQAQQMLDNAGKPDAQLDPNAFQSAYNQQYTSPGAAQAAQAGANSIQTAAQRAKATGTEGGRFALLDQYFGRPQYGFGEKSLDNLLVQRDNRVGSQLQGERSRAQNLGQEAKAFGVDAINQDAQARAGVDTNRDAVRNAWQTANSGFESDLGNRVNQWNTDRDALYGRINEDLSDDALSDESLSSLGLGEGQELGNLSLNDPKYFTKAGDTDRTRLASDQDYARYQALQDLAGEGGHYLDASTRGQAGTAGAPVSFNKDLFTQDLTQSKAAYQNAAPQVNQSVKSYVPMPGNWLNTIDSRTPEQNISDLQGDLAFWQSQNGNPFQAQRVADLQRGISEFQNLQSQYGVGRKITKQQAQAAAAAGG